MRLSSFSLAAWLFGSYAASATAQMGSSNNGKGNGNKPPNIIIFIVDDLGFTQLGFRAKEAGNNEVYTPHIDKHAKEGIIMDRGYMTPWCGPSRAALQTGTYNSFNEGLDNKQFSFDSDIGFAAGLPAYVKTLPQALKEYANYATSYSGKWGIGGTSFMNTPLGKGYDDFLGFFGDSIEACDGWMPPGVQAGVPGSQFFRAVKDYWTQSRFSLDSPVCSFIKDVAQETLTDEEKEIACKTNVRDPPSLIDLDLMDYTQRVIETHDYNETPLFHVHAAQMLHSNMAYPKKYDHESHLDKPGFDYPDYFKFDGVEKPLASARDMRISYANYLRFLDDVFDGIMTSIKDAGQWDNTIVLFTTDNGGAIYTNTASNNYPLRGSKLSKWEGGTRVNQFLSGGWIDKHTTKGRENKSDTFVFAADWAPTLLEMAGSSKELIIGKNQGSTYGNSLWKYIRQSVQAPGAANQLERQVTISPTFQYDVKADTTYKFLHTGESPQLFTRHWGVEWPTDDDAIPDFSYQSIKPCRPGGNALDCCFFDLGADPYESAPLDTIDCAAKYEETTNLYDESRAPACAEMPVLCESKDLDIDQTSGVYSLWSLYGGSGPFTNATGYPIQTPTKCICDVIEDGITEAEVEWFSAGAFSLPKCFKDKPPGNYPPIAMPARVSCKNEGGSPATNNGFQRMPQRGYEESLDAEGIPLNEYRQLNQIEWGFEDVSDPGKLFADSSVLVYQVVFDYQRREGHVEWPKPGKIPFVVLGTDTCVAKHATYMPQPINMFTPWSFTNPSRTATDLSPPKDLCAIWSDNKSWCISKANPLQLPWELTRDGDTVTLQDGTVLSTIDTDACETECSASAESTAYIGTTRYGMAFDGVAPGNHNGINLNQVGGGEGNGGDNNDKEGNSCTQEAKPHCIHECEEEGECVGFPPGQVEGGTPNKKCTRCINRCVKSKCNGSTESDIASLNDLRDSVIIEDQNSGGAAKMSVLAWGFAALLYLMV